METRLNWISDKAYFFSLLPLLARLPSRLAYPLAALLGRNMYRTEAAHREEILKNLRIVFGSDSIWASRIPWIARSFFELLVIDDLEGYYFRSWKASDIDRLYRFEGLSHLTRALEDKRGALLLTGHQGSLCSALVALGLKGFPVSHVSRDYLRDRSLPTAFRSYGLKKVGWMEDRTGYPLTCVQPSAEERKSSSASAVLAIYQALSSNRLISMALDVVPSMVAETGLVSFLGRPARFPTNLVQLANSCGVPVIPYFAVRNRRRPTRQTVRVLPPVPLTRDAAQDLQRCVVELERIILEYPEQWFSWDSLAHFWEASAELPAGHLHRHSGDTTA